MDDDMDNIGANAIGANVIGANAMGVGANVIGANVMGANVMQHTNPIKTILYNPLLVVILGCILVVYYVVRPKVEDDLAPGLSVPELILWTFFILLLLLNGMTHLFQVDIWAYLQKMLFGPELGHNVTTPVMPASSNEVFHIANNKYDYETAKSICAAYDARLATFKEVDTAYAQGGDWCSYGWSEGQMALFPTQYEKWNTLQTIKGHENDCGRPGINGGYMANPQLQFGVNCYGRKPGQTSADALRMQSTPLYPKSLQETNFDLKVRHWRKRLADIVVAPFNHDNWSVL
jgi:hypothetical protein